MEVQLEDPGQEIKRLQRCISDLVALLALPAVWSGSEPSRILEILLDALLPMVCLDLICARVKEPVSEAPIEIIRLAPGCDLKAREIHEMLDHWFEGDDQKSLPVTRKRFADKGISIFPVPVEVAGGTGMILVGSSRVDFPGQTESLLLSVAANEASIGLKEAWLLNQQKRTANQLERQVAERTEGLAASNEKLKKSEAALHKALDEIKQSEGKLRQVIDAIPTLAWCNLAGGPNEFLNKGWHEYTGLSPEESHGWGWQVAFHPEDLPPLMEKWTKMLVSGESDEIEARLRRHDGVYRWFLIRAQPFRDDSGKIVRWYGTSTDIEDRKQAEEARRASERNLAAIINTIPTTAWTTRPDGYCDFLNQVWLDYAGMTVEQAQGWGWAEAIHPDDRKKLVEEWQSCLASGTPVDTEARIRRCDDSYRWFLIRGNPLRDESGNILKWFGTCTDVEDRKKAENALQSSERNLSVMIDAIPAMIHTARPNGYHDYFNRRGLEYLGCSLSDVEGWNWTAWVHPDDMQGMVHKWEAAIASGETFECETRVRGGDGQYRWMFHRKVPLRDEQGNIVRWYGTSLDIEDRKRAEAQVEQAYLRLAEAQRLSKTGSFITDLLADDHNWSEETFRIFEFDSATKVTVKMIRDIVHPEDLPSFDAVIARGMTGTDVDFVFRIVTRRGTVKHVRGMARVMVQIADRPLFIGALQDVTESKLAEEALDRARSELAHVARVTTLNALTASIAHEINQPLSGIITNASTCLRMLNGTPPNIDGARETARRTIRDGNRASDMITRLRALFSKKESTLEPLDVNEATREVLALSLSDLQRNRVILRSELEEDLPPIIGDRVQLQQVILNLLRNASEAMVGVEGRPRQLLIRTRREGDNHVRLSVQDVGTGISPQDFEKLFEAFYTTKSDGMGIGLSLSRSIIERHHGRLWAEPNEGPGATFSFSIPCGPERATSKAA